MEGMGDSDIQSIEKELRVKVLGGRVELTSPGKLGRGAYPLFENLPLTSYKR